MSFDRLMGMVAISFAISVYAFEPAPLELVPNGDLTFGAIRPDCSTATSAEGWYVLGVSRENVRLEPQPGYGNGTLSLTRLKRGVAPALYRPGVALDASERYRLKCRVRQTGGNDAAIEVAGKTFKIPFGDQWQDLVFEFQIPETSASPNFKKEVAIYCRPPSSIGGALSVDYVSLAPILPDKIEPKDKKILIENIAGGVPLTAIFVRENAPDGELLAAHHLRRELYKYCGYSIPVFYLGKDEKTTLPAIYVGEAATRHGILHPKELKGLGLCGYALRVTGGEAGISGETVSGTICGAAALANDLGVHPLRRNPFHLNLDETIVPEAPTITIENRFICRKPVFAYNLYLAGNKSVGLPWGFSWEGAFMGDPTELGGACGGWVHDANYLVPITIYGERHPEYFAMGKNGRRLKVVSGSRFDCQLCMSNPDVQRIAGDNLLKWMEAQKDRKYFVVSPGDGLGYCECEKCRAWDADATTYSKTDRYLRFVNILAKAVAKKFPDKRVVMLSYTARTEEPPKRERPETNVDVMYCLWSSDWPCKQHPYCRCSHEGVDNLAAWTRFMPGRVHIFDYPWYTLADATRLRYFHKKGIVGVAHCGFRGQFPELTTWILGKMFWDIDVDVSKEIDKFMALFYGPAAPFTRRYFDLIQNAVDLYAHEGERDGDFPREFEPTYPTGRFLLTAEEMDKAYELFAAAEKSVAEKPEYLKRIREEKRSLLMVDLNQRNPMKGLAGAGKNAFPKRLAEFLTLAKKDYKNFVFYSYPIDRWLMDIARLKVDAGNWRNDAALNAFLKNPETTLCFDENGQSDIPGGWRLPAWYSFGAERLHYRDRDCVIVRRPSSGNGMTRFVLKLSERPIREFVLAVDGMDDDKPGRALLEIHVNGKKLFSGQNDFKENQWSRVVIRLPAETLKLGENEIVFRNITPDDEGELTDDVAIQAAGSRKYNYNWGWLAVSGVDVIANADSQRR